MPVKDKQEESASRRLTLGMRNVLMRDTNRGTRLLMYGVGRHGEGRIGHAGQPQRIVFMVAAWGICHPRIGNIITLYFEIT